MSYYIKEDKNMNVLKKIKNNVKKVKLPVITKILAFGLSSFISFYSSILLSMIFALIYPLFSGENITKETFHLIIIFNSLALLYPIVNMSFNRIKEEHYIPNKNEIEAYLCSLNNLDKENAVNLIIEKSIDNKNQLTFAKLLSVDKKIKSVKEEDKINHIEFRKTMLSYLSKEEIKEKELV